MIQRVLARWKLATGQIEIKVMRGGDRKDYLDAVWDMYKKSYSSIGLHVSSAQGLMEYDQREVFLEEDNPIAFNLYKITSHGLKTGLLGSNGSSTAKAVIKDHIKTRYRRPGIYGEVSHAVEKLSEGAPIVCAVNVPAVLGKTVIPMEDGVHYQRKLEGIGVVTKKMVGNPKGVSSTSGSCPIPERPGEPLSPNEVKMATHEKLAELDAAEHATCQLSYD